MSVIRFKRHFQVPQERLWYAVSDRQGAKLWLNTIEQLELRVGGAFSIRTYDENNPAAWTTGIVTEVQPPQVLKYTWNQGPYGGGPAMQSKVSAGADNNLIIITRGGYYPIVYLKIITLEI